MTNWYLGHIVLLQAIFTSLIMAYSVQFPIRVGVFTFSSVGCYAIGGYTTAVLTATYDWPQYPAVAVGMIIAAVVSVALGLVLQNLDGLYLAMATIAFDLILVVVATNWQSVTGGATGMYGVLGEVSMPELIGIAVVITVLLAISERGRMGRRITAVGADPELAWSVGVSVRNYRYSAFVVSGLLGALAGGLNTLIRTTISPVDVGFPLVVTALTMIIVGGARSWLGAFIGAIVFTWLPSLLQVISTWQAVIYGVIVALAAVWLPGGIVGTVTTFYRKRTRATAPDAEGPTEAEVRPVDSIVELGVDGDVAPTMAPDPATSDPAASESGASESGASEPDTSGPVPTTRTTGGSQMAEGKSV